VPVHLTFDDGPDPRWTPLVLDVLAEAGARATFFVLGERVAQAPEPMLRAAAEGHEIALHGDRHVRHDELARDELDCDTDRALERLAGHGVDPVRWRAPWGVETADSRAIAQERDIELVGWTLDTHDWRGDTAARMHATCAPLITDGAVVLMHDGLGPGARREHCAATIDLAAGLSRRAHQLDLRLESLAGAAPEPA
jgi:peptidoglycan/xylan/chitin deacetylase (PgdA/CDA1 family)